MLSPKQAAAEFSAANKFLREGIPERAIELYRGLLSNDCIKIYRENLLRALHGASKGGQELEAGVSPEQVRRKSSVLFVAAGLLGPTPGGGIATCFHNLIKVLAANENVSIDVLYVAHPYYGRGNRQVWADYYASNFNARLLTLNINKKNYGSEEMNRSHAVDEYLAKNDGLYDTVVFHDFMGLGYYSLLSKRYGLSLAYTRIVVSAHGNHELSYFFGSKKAIKWNEKATMFMERTALRLADVVTTPSQYYADWLSVNFGVDAARHMPNIIFKDPRPPEVISLSLVEKIPTVVFYGRMERLKGLDTLLRCVGILADAGISINLVFAGNTTKIDGIDASEYVLDRLKGSPHNVHFVINTSPSSIFEFCKVHGGVAVYPTLGETSSCVVVESIVHNAPFIASDIPGIKELIRPEDHKEVLFEAGCPVSLADALRRSFLEKKSAELSFDMHRNIESWTEFLSEIPRFHKIISRGSSSRRVSVVIPTCDRPELLALSIDSMLRQTHKPHEVIVVDDASTEWEKNSDLCAARGVKYHRLLEKGFKGHACNLAVAKAEGDLICFFDDDDLAKPEMLATYVAAYAADPDVDVFSCFADYFEHAGWLDSEGPKTDYVSLSLGGSLETNLLANFFGKGSFIVSRDKFLAIGGYEGDAHAVPMVDYRFYIKASLSGLQISTIPRPLYHYRKNSPNSLFYKNKDDRRLNFLARKSMEKILVDKCGSGVGNSLAHLVWNMGLPLYE